MCCIVGMQIYYMLLTQSGHTQAIYLDILKNQTLKSFSDDTCDHFCQISSSLLGHNVISFIKSSTLKSYHNITL